MEDVKVNAGGTNKPLELDIDKILTELQGTSLWQWGNFFLLCLPSMASGFLVLAFSFTGNFSHFITCIDPVGDIYFTRLN